MPVGVRTIAGRLPLTYLADGLRAVMNAGAHLGSIGTDLLGLAIWMVAPSGVAVRTCRWE